MIEVAFKEGVAGALQASGLQKLSLLNGHSSAEIVPLTLNLDIGELKDFGSGTEGRMEICRLLYGSIPDVAEEIAIRHEKSLSRLKEAKDSLEPVRIWARKEDPSEMCGLLFLCNMMEGSEIPLYLVNLPDQIEYEESITIFRNSEEIPPNILIKLSGGFKPLSILQRKIYAAMWKELVQENAPLRAIVNGKLMSVNSEFYDFALYANVPEEQFTVAQLLGNTLLRGPGIDVWWLFQRIQAMVEKGELREIKPPEGENPFSGIMKKC